MDELTKLIVKNEGNLDAVEAEMRAERASIARDMERELAFRDGAIAAVAAMRKVKASA